MSRRHRRVPLEPLLRVLGEDPAELTDGQVALITGVAPRQVQRWKVDGGMTLRHADRVATHVWLHPVLIWPEVYAEG